jgi:hypothetical protein
MKNIENMIETRNKNPEWDKNIARKVLNEKARIGRRNRSIGLAACVLLVMTAATGYFYQANQTLALRSTINYLLSETISAPGENTVISKDLDEKILQYCMNGK